MEVPKMNKIISKISSVLSVFKRAKSKIKAAQQPVAAVRPSGRVRARDVVAAAPKAALQPTPQPVKKATSPKKKISIKIPSLKIGFRLDLLKISSLADSLIRSSSKREIEGFYGTKNYKSVLLSIASDRSEENFLAVKRELKAQDVLISRFPGKILKSAKLSQRKANVEVELNKLENELAASAREKRNEASFRGRISSLDSQVSVFRELKKLPK
jgi:hypothetical protein